MHHCRGCPGAECGGGVKRNRDVFLSRCGCSWALVLAVTLSVALPVSALEVRLRDDGRALEIDLRNLPAGAYELVLDTPGLQHVETSASVGEPGIIYLPPPRPGESSPPEAELYFFFNSLAEADGWELVIEFLPQARGDWSINGRFSGRQGRLPDRAVIPVAELEHGENLLHVCSSVLAVPRFSYRRTLVGAGAIEMVPVLAPWAGTVTLRAPSGGTIASVSVSDPRRRVKAGPAPSASTPAAALPDSTALRDAAWAVGRNLVANEVTDPNSLFAGGFHLVYDAAHDTPRMAHWLWSWGPAIRLLLELEATAETREEVQQAQTFREQALRAARRSLDFGVTDVDHPAFGVSTVRWEPSRATPSGWAEYISTADSLFLAGWGWMAAYRASGDSEFLERTKTLVAAAEWLMNLYPVVPQDWIVERDRWTPHTLDESLFGLTGFFALHRATADPAVAAAGKRFLDSHLVEMSREDGLLERAWLREEDRALWDPDIKGHAWVVEGYLAGYALSGEQRYLALAMALAERILAVQSASGAWAYLFEAAAENGPFDDKGTAIWAYYLYRLYGHTNDERHLDGARKALSWCLQRQYRGPHPRLDGGLLHENTMAYVRRRPLTILYSTTFFGLALLEELRLRGSASGRDEN